MRAASLILALCIPLTACGAVAGGAIGRKVQGDSQEKKGDRVVERRCERVYR